MISFSDQLGNMHTWYAVKSVFKPGSGRYLVTRMITKWQFSAILKKLRDLENRSSPSLGQNNRSAFSVVEHMMVPVSP